MNKEMNVVVGIIVVVVAFTLARGSDGLICKYVYPSAYTQAEKNFWTALAGCDCRQSASPAKKAVPRTKERTEPTKGASSQTKNDRDSQLRITAGLGDTPKVKALIAAGGDVNAPGPGTAQVPAGGTALMLAAARNHQDVVELLLSEGANPNQADEGGGTALIYACWKGNSAIVRTLLENGADVNASTRDGRTPTIVARNAGHSEIVTVLDGYKRKE